MNVTENLLKYTEKFFTSMKLLNKIDDVDGKLMKKDIVLCVCEFFDILLKADFEAEFVLSKIAAKSLKASFTNFDVESEGTFSV